MQGAIGTPRLVYAEMEDGPVFRSKWAGWRSQSGAPWPGLHEFEIGCTLEHAGYALSWLVSLFGAVESLTAFSALTFPDKGPGTREIVMAPDFSVGCLRFRSGTVARLTSGLGGAEGSIADHPRRQRLDHRCATSGTTARRSFSRNWTDRASCRPILANRLETRLKRFLPWKPDPGRRLRYPPRRVARILPGFPFADRLLRAASRLRPEPIETGQRPFFSGNRALHITELALALNNAAGLAAALRGEEHFLRLMGHFAD